MTTFDITIAGAGLAGSECALQLAESGMRVRLVEMKPHHRNEAQNSDNPAELVCSNSLRANGLHNAVGVLKEEMRRLGSYLMEAADATAVPAGGALAVDREAFSARITKLLEDHPNITLEHREFGALDTGADEDIIIATGPLTHGGLKQSLEALLPGNLYFYDAIAPIIAADSIDRDVVFACSRYGKGDGDDYLNVPLNEEEYHRFVEDILAADTVPLRDFEDARYFEGCLPIEIICSRGPMTAAFGPMKPVGLNDPRTGEQPFAVIQLRKENLEGSAYNLVGFQTKMTWPAQQKLLESLPGLGKVEVLRYGSIHRNMFINAPQLLTDGLALKDHPRIRFAGQITGVEGYVESMACGLALAYIIRMERQGEGVTPPPQTTSMGALLSHLHTPNEDFQPSNIHFGHFAPVPGKKMRKRHKKEFLAKRALEEITAWRDSLSTPPVGPVRIQQTPEDNNGGTT